MVEEHGVPQSLIEPGTGKIGVAEILRITLRRKIQMLGPKKKERVKSIVEESTSKPPGAGSREKPCVALELLSSAPSPEI